MGKHYKNLGFNAIRDANYTSRREEVMRRGLGRFFNGFQHFKTMSCFHLWKEGMYQQTKYLTDEFLAAKKRRVEMHNVEKSRVQHKRAKMFSDKLTKDTMKDCFDALIEHKRARTLVQQRTKALNQKRQMVAVRFAVRKWQLKARESAHQRQ